MAGWFKIGRFSVRDNDRICGRCSATTDPNNSCMCASPFPYKRLEDEKHERPVKIIFHKLENSDQGKVSLDVRRDLTVVEVCKVVAKMMGYNTTAFWSMVEYWVDKKAERVLEEHEIMVDVYNEMIKFKRKANVRYVLRQVISKFDILSDPSRIRNEGGIICENPQYFEDYHDVCYIETIVDQGICPVFFSGAGLQIEDKHLACFLLLRDQRLFYTADQSGVHRLMQLGEMYIRKHVYTDGPIHVQDIPGIVLIGKLSELNVYRVEKDRPDQKDHLLLRPAATPRLRNALGTVEPVEEDPYVGIPVLPKALIRLTGLSDNFATTWIALMRLAKYGKQLRENYRAFKSKNDTSSREFSRANVPNQEPPSPLFRRRGCREHLGERANLRRYSHDHLALLDFSGREYRISSRGPVLDSRRTSITFYRYLVAIEQVPKDREMSLGRMTRSIRRKLRIDRQEPRNVPPKPTIWPPEEPQPSTSGSRHTNENLAMVDLTERHTNENLAMVDLTEIQVPDTVENSEKAKKFGAIRKIFSMKNKKSGKKKKEDKLYILPGPSKEPELHGTVVNRSNSSENLFSQEESLIRATTTSEDVGATALYYFPVSAVEQSLATGSTSEAGNETQPPILERVEKEKSQMQKAQVVYEEDENEEDFPNFALIGADGEFIHDYYPEHLNKDKKSKS